MTQLDVLLVRAVVPEAEPDSGDSMKDKAVGCVGAT